MRGTELYRRQKWQLQRDLQPDLGMLTAQRAGAKALGLNKQLDVWQRSTMKGLERCGRCLVNQRLHSLGSRMCYTDGLAPCGPH